MKRLWFLFTTGIKVLRNFGPKIFLHKVKRFFAIKLHGNKQAQINEEYQVWIKKNTLTQKDLQKLKSEISDFKYQPKLSVLMPVFNVEERFLREAIESV